MGSGGDNELAPEDRVTRPVRVYRGDWILLTRTARELTAKRAANEKKMTVPDVIHELCRQLREQERGSGT